MLEETSLTGILGADFTEFTFPPLPSTGLLA